MRTSWHDPSKKFTIPSEEEGFQETRQGMPEQVEQGMRGSSSHFISACCLLASTIQYYSMNSRIGSGESRSETHLCQIYSYIYIVYIYAHICIKLCKYICL